MPDTAADAVRAALRSGHEHLVEAIDDVKHNRPDAVHQVRVAARGLRSDARVFRDLLDEAWIAHLRSELSWLAGACGPARDLEVIAEWLDELDDDPDLPLNVADVARVRATITARRLAAEETARKATQSRRTRALVAYILAGASTAPFNDQASQPSADILKPLVGKAWRRYAKAARRLVVDPEPTPVRHGHPEHDDDSTAGRQDDPSSDAAWHEARVRAKRARYVARSAGTVLSTAGVEEAAKKAQTQLGHHQDRVVAAAMLTELGRNAEATSVAFTAGRLAEIARRERRPIRASFSRPKKRPPGLE